jgi:hypothetical protein
VRSNRKTHRYTIMLNFGSIDQSSIFFSGYLPKTPFLVHLTQKVGLKEQLKGNKSKEMDAAQAEAVERALAQKANECYPGTAIPLFFRNFEDVLAALPTFAATGKFTWSASGRQSATATKRVDQASGRLEDHKKVCKNPNCSKCANTCLQLNFAYYQRAFRGVSAAGSALVKATATCLCPRSCLGCVVQVTLVDLTGRPNLDRTPPHPSPPPRTRGIQRITIHELVFDEHAQSDSEVAEATQHDDQDDRGNQDAPPPVTPARRTGQHKNAQARPYPAPAETPRRRQATESSTQWLATTLRASPSPARLSVQHSARSRRSSLRIDF